MGARKIAKRVTRRHKGPEVVGTSDHAVFQKVESQKTRRTAILAAAAAGAVAVSASFGFDACEKIVNGAVPKRDMQMEAKSSLSKVELPASSVLVLGTGDATATMDVRPVVKNKVGGFLFNNTIGKVAGNKTGVTRKGSIQIIAGPVGVDRPAIKLSPYELPASKPGSGKKYGIHADIDVSQLSAHTVDMKTVKNFSDPELFDTSSAKNISDYTSTMTNAADDLFKYSCGRALDVNIKHGAEKIIKGYVRSSADLLSMTEGEGQTLRRMAAQPPDIDFHRTITLPSGIIKTVPVNPENIVVPGLIRPTSEKIAEELDRSPEDVHLDPQPEGCLYTPQALEQQVDILTKGRPKHPQPGV